MSNSLIEWTGKTWNPLTGCDKVSHGCLNCYMFREAMRLRKMGNRRYKNDTDLTLHPDIIDKPKSWKKGSLIFVNSMSDLFHEGVPPEFIRAAFETMHVADQHIYQILTKRGKRLRRLGPELPWPDHIWMGVSVENDEPIGKSGYAPTDRIDDLRASGAQVTWLSIEPLLGPLPSLDLSDIDWVVVGGESTKKKDEARPLKLKWVRSIIERCRAQGVPVFVKQLGTAWAAESGTYAVNKKGGDPSVWPKDLRIREYPDTDHPVLADLQLAPA